MRRVLGVVALFACPMYAAEPAPWPFEGCWGDGVEYTAKYRREAMQPGCDYDDVKQVAINRWEIEAECLVSFNEVDEDGDTLRRNRDSTTRIVLTLNGNRLIEHLTFDIDDRPEFPVHEPLITEYERCDE